MFHPFITAAHIQWSTDVLAKFLDILRRRHRVNSSSDSASVARSISRPGCKYFRQNWLQGLSRRDLRHQIFCNWGSPATFSMFYTNLKMASISHETPVSELTYCHSGVFKFSSRHDVKQHVHVHVSTHYIFDINFLIETAVACLTKHILMIFVMKYQMTKMGMRRGECPTLHSATHYFRPIRHDISSTLTNKKPIEVQSRDVPTLCVITSSPGIGLSDHRPPTGRNQVFQEISSGIILALHYISDCSNG